MAINVSLTDTKSGTISSLSGAVLQSQNANFAASDVGRLVYMTNGPALRQWRRIISFQSATQVTLNAPWNQAAFRALLDQQGNRLSDVLPVIGNTFSLSLDLDDLIALDTQNTLTLQDGIYQLSNTGGSGTTTGSNGEIRLGAGVCVNVINSTIRGIKLGSKMFLGEVQRSNTSNTVGASTTSMWVFGSLEWPTNDDELPYTFNHARLEEAENSDSGIDRNDVYSNRTGSRGSNVQMLGGSYDNKNLQAVNSDTLYRVFWRLYSETGGGTVTTPGDAYQHRFYDVDINGKFGMRIQGEKSLINNLRFNNSENYLSLVSSSSFCNSSKHLI